MLSSDAVGRMLNAVERAESYSISAWSTGQIATEPSFTDRFIASLENSLENEGVTAEGYHVSIRTLRDRGPKAPEREFGADVAFILNIDTPDFRWTKGFLAQAKMTLNENVVEPDAILVRRSSLDEGVPTSLFSQSTRMLRYTPASFVFYYTTVGIFVIPASAIASLASGHEYVGTHAKRMRAFMMDFFSCFIGDWRMGAWDDSTLRRMVDTYNARTGIIFSITGTNQILAP